MFPQIKVRVPRIIRVVDKDGRLVSPLPPFAKDKAGVLAMYTDMVRTRVFDQKAVMLQRTGRISTYAESLGQEAVGVGIGYAMCQEDVLCPTYREHGAQFVRGVKMEEILLYWGGDERGSNFSEYPASSDFPICVPIASQTLHAAGAAYAFALRGEKRAVVTVCGDGGTSRGDFYTAMNFAGVHKLPVVFVVVNNQYAISLPRERQTATKTLAEKAVAAGFRGAQVDGNDVIAVRMVLEEALKEVKAGRGPLLVEALTYRMSNHTTADDASRYRPSDEVEAARERDPIVRLYKALMAHTDWWSCEEDESLKESCKQKVAEAVSAFENTLPRSAGTMFDHLHLKLPQALESQRALAEASYEDTEEKESKSTGTRALVGRLDEADADSGLTLVEAVNQALRHELKEDESVILLGEDIGVNGGVFRATLGLQEMFGAKRVIDTQLDENMIAGITVGKATAGLRPVAEFQFLGFIPAAFDQLISHASRMRNRTQGRLSCPAVFRAPYGGGIRAPEHHSESTEAVFAHIPGLRVVIPSSPKRAYGLLLAAIRDPDPVVFLEPKRIYRAFREEVPDDGIALPLDKAFVERQGSDVTLISWGAMMKETRQVADMLADEGINAEVIDVATLKYLDMETIAASVAKTGRCVIIHEAPFSGGWGAEIAARVADECMLSLFAPIKRVTGFDTVMPLFKLEKSYLPSVGRIIDTVRGIMQYA